MKLPRRRWIHVTVFFILGIVAGYTWWSLDVPDKMKNRRLAYTFGTKMIGINPEDAEIQELIQLIQQKIRDLKNAKMLVSRPLYNKCVKNEKVLTICIDPNCSRPLPPTTSPENIKSIRKPVKAIGVKKLREVIDAFNVKPERKRYVFVTGASSNHFAESQAAIQSLHETVLPHISNYSFYYYDLGLKENERQLVREHSGAELKSFPFDKLPDHMRRLKCYTWKPLIALAHLQHTEFLVWMDASLHFTKDIRPYFKNASKTGLLHVQNPYVIAQHTYLKEFTYFGDEACQFSSYTEVEGGFFVLHNEQFTHRLIIEPLSACALDENCMCPQNSRKLLWCDMKIRKYGKCHRYDQSTIGYLTTKVLREYRNSFFITDDCHVIRQGQRGSYLVDKHKAKKSKTTPTTTTTRRS